MTLKYRIRPSARALAIALATGATPLPALAQDAAATDAQQSSPARGGAEQAASGDIIVTAERRAVSIQKIPVSISAIGGEDLVQRNITSPSLIQQVVPAVKFVEIGQQPSLLIRGTGQPVANVFNDPSASFNIDGVAIARPLAINGLFFDLERVEVLKGPQGTLYGRNATVGAINVISRRPTQQFEGEVALKVESYNGVEARGVVNVPITDTLAFRGGFVTNRHDGYLSNGTNDADSIGGRAKLLWEPSTDFDLMLTATLYRDNGNGVGDVPLKSPTGSFLTDDPWFVAVGPSLNPADGATRVPDDAEQDLRSNTYTAELNYNFGGAKLTVVPAYIETSYDALTYNGGFRQRIVSTDKQKSVEARLASTADGPLEWIVGGIYLKDEQSSFNDLKTRPTARQIQNTFAADLESYAAFAQATYSLTDALRLTGGVRYTHDDKLIRGVFINVADVPGDPVLSSFPSDGDATFEDVSWRVGVDADVGRDNLVYANVATGYKAGGFQPGIAPNVFKPESITSYTIGSKNRFLDRKVTVNLEAWYWDYRNYHFVQFGFVNPLPNFALTTLNAPKVENYGLELQSAFQPTPNDRLTVDLAYVISKYKEFSAPAFPLAGVPATDYSGQYLNRAPKLSGIVAYTRSIPIRSGGRFDLSVKTQFETRSRIVPQNILGAEVGGNHVTDADVTFFSDGDRYRLGVFVTNIENEPVIYFAGNTPAGLWGHPRPPRIIGIRGGALF